MVKEIELDELQTKDAASFGVLSGHMESLS